MNSQEAKRFAHKLAADAIMGVHVPAGEDRQKIVRALGALAEQHQRFGPKRHDRVPRPPEYKGEKLSFDGDNEASEELRLKMG